MKRYCNVEPILHLLSDKDLLESVNVGAVLQVLQHGLYNGEVVPVVHARWKLNANKNHDICTNCGTFASMWFDDDGERIEWLSDYCPNCGAKMDEKEGNI